MIPLEEEFLGAEPPTGKVPGHDRFQRLLCADRQEMAQRHCVIDVPLRLARHHRLHCEDVLR